jgi:diguanylate cyclase (GGDEF)-like protein
VHLDVSTLGIIGFLIGVVLSLGFTLLGVLLSGERALRLWVTAYWLGTIGALLGGLRGDIPDVLTSALGNSCFVLSNMLVMLGVAEHLGRRVDRRWPWLVSLLFVLGFFGYTLVTPAVVVRMALFSMQFMLWDAWTIAVLLQAPEESRRSARFAALLFALDFAFNGLRLGMLAHGDLGPDPAYGPAMVAAFVFGILMALAQTFALVLLMAERLVAALRRQARVDGLTGLLNRDALFDDGADMLQQCRLRGRACTLLLFDLDHFKRINDRYGHAVGDAVLRHFAALVRRHAPSCAHLFARYGGEEFVLLLPDTDAAQAMALAEHLRRCVADSPLPTAQGEVALSTCIGVATSDEHADFERMLSAADDALYRAKAAGRNCVLAAAHVLVPASG